MLFTSLDNSKCPLILSTDMFLAGGERPQTQVEVVGLQAHYIVGRDPFTADIEQTAMGFRLIRTGSGFPARLVETLRIQQYRHGLVKPILNGP